jgi:predicted SAM-dependent methyltransferase
MFDSRVRDPEADRTSRIEDRTPRIMDLHLGCGPVHRPGWLNVDRSRNSAADLVADARCLPFRDGAFERIEALQLLEHLGCAGAVFALADWRRVLAPGGALVIETPDPEGSFRRFLEAPDRDARARELGWIFGEESPGQEHRVLFPLDMLAELLERAGFDIERREEPRTWTSEPGARVLCRRRASPLHDALAEVRSRAFAGRLLRADCQPEVVEFENGFARNAAWASQARGAEDRIAENVAFSAPLAEIWLEACGRTGALEARTADPWRTAARELARAGLPARLHAAFRRLADSGGAFRDGYEFVLAKGQAAARRAARGEGPTGPLLEEEGLPAAAGAAPSFFGKIRCVEFADSLRNRGLRAFGAGDLEAAARWLRASANLRVEPLYAFWNLAVLRAATGDLESAARDYEEALRVAPPSCRALLVREAAVLRLHRGEYETAAALLADAGEVPDRDALRAVAMERMGLGRSARALYGGAAGEPPPLRTRPVPVGEGAVFLDLDREKGA